MFWKKTAVKLAGRLFFWGEVKYLINWGFPNKKGREQTKVKKVNKGGMLNWHWKESVG